ncbi:ATP-dependent sacrificial sulfur transferase LarE [Actinoallomurus rhizosphaericola]|uniref:ATP-dependent sacrificial sulfur transferase LarE n=1 Tax=Actinoallomurus rhizosphaericola TaxID=2952536 RepID=UPI0020929E69|nr:ATP-dependent sacrificial sulfur transferase LarE [Actinoallomurus rhizosphaericola]MCO5998188.1 ATP-dependent sacrificial sulfur transferase LarE [Actinoallomurus rhizosphaericola]
MVDVVVLSDSLLTEMAGYGRTLVAFSGGVDSSVVLAAAARALGPEQVAAVTAVSASLPAAELDAARRFCADLGVTHHTPATSELEVPGYRENGPQRCYFCKSVLLDTANALADHLGYSTITTGTNASDVVAGFRPGIRAAAERGARTPLADLGLDKDAVRAIARHWDLPMWDKPAAACMASRVAYGIEVTSARLKRIERAETAVRGLFGGAVRDLRVRDLGDAVRLEVDPDLVDRARDDEAVHAAIREAGFTAAPIRVEVFRSGSMNDRLAASER